MGPGRRAPTVEALGAQAVLLHTANFSALKLAQPQLFGFRWSPPWFLAVSGIAAVIGSWLGIGMPATTAVVTALGALLVAHVRAAGIYVLVRSTLAKAIVVALHVPSDCLERRKLITSRRRERAGRRIWSTPLSVYDAPPASRIEDAQW